VHSAIIVVYWLGALGGSGASMVFWWSWWEIVAWFWAVKLWALLTLWDKRQISPAQDGKPLNYFVYPYVEVDREACVINWRRFVTYL
jgi:hypothetical protein